MPIPARPTGELHEVSCSNCRRRGSSPLYPRRRAHTMHVQSIPAVRMIHRSLLISTLSWCAAIDFEQLRTIVRWKLFDIDQMPKFALVFALRTPVKMFGCDYLGQLFARFLSGSVASNPFTWQCLIVLLESRARNACHMSRKPWGPGRFILHAYDRCLYIFTIKAA